MVPCSFYDHQHGHGTVDEIGCCAASIGLDTNKQKV